VDTLLQKGHIPRGYLGVGLQAVRLPDALRDSLQRKEKTGVILLEVEPGGPAHKAGMLIGDILVSLAGQSIARFEDVQAHLRPENIGKSLTAKIVRGGAVQEVSIPVAERPRGDN
jgi:S1-C subfamily serine protease